MRHSAHRQKRRTWECRCCRHSSAPGLDVSGPRMGAKTRPTATPRGGAAPVPSALPLEAGRARSARPARLLHRGRPAGRAGTVGPTHPAGDAARGSTTRPAPRPGPALAGRGHEVKAHHVLTGRGALVGSGGIHARNSRHRALARQHKNEARCACRRIRHVRGTGAASRPASPRSRTADPGSSAARSGGPEGRRTAPPPRPGTG